MDDTQGSADAQPTAAPPLPSPSALPANFRPITLPGRSAPTSAPPPGEAWPVPKSRLSDAGPRAPSKHVFFDGPFGDQIRVHIETVAMLKDWKISDTMLYFMRKGIEKVAQEADS